MRFRGVLSFRGRKQPPPKLITASPEMETLERCPLCVSSRLEIADAEFGFARCSECGLIFDNPRPTLGEIVRHYSANDRYDGWLSAMAVRDALALRRVRKLLRYACAGTLLDVGTGIGQFLHHAKPYFTNVVGTEVSESGAAIARSRYGLTVLTGQIEDLELPMFDNVTMLHVLEHVPHPARTLSRCYSLLRPGGMLLVCVPNDTRSWTSRLRALSARLKPNEMSPILGLPRVLTTNEIHLSHFTAPTLRRALTAAGFSVRAIDCDPYFAASGWRLGLHAANYYFHLAFALPTYQALWAVAYR